MCCKSRPCGLSANSGQWLMICKSVCMGPSTSSSKTWGEISRFVMEEFETVMMLPVSRPKLALVTNTSSSAKKFKISFVRLSRSVVKSARNLGMDYAAGARRFSSARIKRFGVVARRARRLSVLARPGRRAATVVRMSLAPSALYGIGITGMLPSHLQRLRGFFMVP